MGGLIEQGWVELGGGVRKAGREKYRRHDLPRTCAAPEGTSQSPSVFSLIVFLCGRKSRSLGGTLEGGEFFSTDEGQPNIPSANAIT